MSPVRSAAPIVPVVEREEELAAIEALLVSARAGSGSVLVVEGPAGIGKTTLLGAARRQAAADGMRVLHARGAELEREFPFGVVRQCLESTIRPERDRQPPLRGAARLAGPVLIDASDAGDASPAGILHGLHWLVANLAEESAVLLVVDDAQWADEPSLRFLAYLARRVESLPVALVIAARDEADSNGRWMAPLAAIREDPASGWMSPQALAVAGVERLLREHDGAPVDTVFAGACHAATGGNPFLLGELVRALRRDGVPFTAAGAARVTDVTPPAVARAVTSSLARLPAYAVALGRAAAILGDGAALELAAELGEVPVEQAATAAADLVRAGLFDDATALRFRHPILAGAVLAGLSTRERAQAHGRAAALLRSRGAAPERLALQLLHTTPAGDGQVVAELRQAAERARGQGAPATTAALLERALAEPPEPALRGDVLFELGRAALATGRAMDGAEHLAAAHRCAVDPLTRGRAVALLAQAVRSDPSTRERIVGLAEVTLREVETLDRDLALRLRAVLALAGRTDETLVPGETVGEAIYMGSCVFTRMSPSASAAEIADLAERAGRQVDGLLAEGAASLAFTGMVLGLRWADRLDAAERLLDRAIAVARLRGSTIDFATAMTLRATVRLRAGRLLDAEADARVALVAALDPEWSFARGVVPLVGSLLDQGRGPEAAREFDAFEVDEEVPDTPPMTPVLLARMRLRAGRREHAGALADWEDAVRRVRGVNAGWIEDLVVVAEVHRALGDRTAAGAVVAQALELAHRWGTPGAIGQALLAQARLAEAEASIEILRTAVDLLAESPARLEEARARVSLGAALRRRGHRVESRTPLREGYELAQRCGATGLAEAARAELRASGIRLRREAVTGADALTASERRIADMAAGGLSNTEIAQGLFLTVKTIEMHLTQVYRKLDVRGRAEVARALGLEPQGRGPGSAP